MPKTWHERHAVNKIDEDGERDFYRAIVADRKPYFMRYIYPALMKQYNTFIKNTDRNALREFHMRVAEMQKLPYQELSDRQREFLRYFDYRMPVGVGDCVMNKICKKFEEAFDGYIGRHNSSSKFDYRIMRSDAEYSSSQYYAIKKLYDDFNRRRRNYAIFADYEKIDECDYLGEMSIMNDEFRKACDLICPNKDALCNIVLDVCYTKNATKRFAWSMCGEDIIHNLLQKHNNTISFPTLDKTGDICYCGEKFSVVSRKLVIE